ncbi:OB-fold nucleic acid binding domain-containing protein, partial [uncultured Bartonella sp.]|uniref:OB-fold nucleic acid binding domain-containing protein n=1 Tax=uncultured Bartonella sp. TaxID=104108 RepID=UPI00342E13AD
LTMEDESGIANIVVWPKKMVRFRREVMGGKLLLVTGKIQRDSSGVTHLVAAQIEDRSMDLINLSEMPDRFSDFESEPVAHHPRQFRAFPKSRDFH